MDELVRRPSCSYRLISLRGQGGFGQVYQAEDMQFHGQWAIKMLSEQYLSDPDFRKRFLREVRIQASLNHPNVVQVYDVIEQGPRILLVMPLYKETLEDIIKGQPLALDKVQNYLEQICTTLDYIHARKIMHLDLKPGNLLVHEDGHLLLADFGLARQAEQGSVQGGISLQFGTAKYMAPEQIQGKPGLSSDIYALGITLYQMLTGHVPFEGNEHEVKNKHLYERPLSVCRARPELPRALNKVLSKALAKKPEERYQSAGELLADFKAALAEEAEKVPFSISIPPSVVQGAGAITLGAGLGYLLYTQKFDKLVLALVLVGAFVLLLSYESGRGESGLA